MPLYHHLDRFYRHIPWPGKVEMRVDVLEGVNRIRLVRRYLGREIMPVFCYAFGDTLVDSGMPASAHQIASFASERGLGRAFVTHHHEDHSGGVAALIEAGVEVLASPLTACLLAHDLPLPLYQHIAWGRARPAELRGISSEIFRIGPYEARVIAASGHAVDQVVLHVPERGWLFAGDVFIHERVKIFRRDEDFVATLTTLERLLKLDFDTLFCGHRPLARGGKQALARKLTWLRELEVGARRYHAEGCDLAEIVRRLGIAVQGGLVLMSSGDASPENLVRSILHGPTPRSEIDQALEQEGIGV